MPESGVRSVLESQFSVLKKGRAILGLFRSGWVRFASVQEIWIARDAGDQSHQIVFDGLALGLRLVFCQVVFLAFDGGPGGGAEGTTIDGLGIDHDVGWLGLQGSEPDVGGGGAKGAQEERGGAVIDLLGDEQAHDLGQAELDGVRVLEGGEVNDAVLAKFHVNLAAHEAALLVEVTMSFIAHGG